MIKSPAYSWGLYYLLEAAPRLELGMKDLQSSALPLGYAAITLDSIASMGRCVKKILTALPRSHLSLLRYF